MCAVRNGRLLLILAFLLTALPAKAQEGYTNVPIREVLTGIAERTGYRFLYRDALVAGKRVSVDGDQPLANLAAALEPHGLQLRVDSVRKQVLLLERRMPADTSVVRGVVVDDDNGTRLPYASVTWRDGGALRGAVADESGSFRLQFDAAGAYELTVSYVGYESETIRLDRAAKVIPVRLKPADTFGPEVIVSTAALQTELDTSWHHLVHEGVFSALGNGGVLRSLQVLPAVSFSTAASSGLNVRGSRVDGFQVLLDGMSVYSQDHFFGLFDAFNEDVLQAVGLYYGIPPASLQGPPGGTVAFVTRTGSQRDYRGSIGLGSTSGTLTLEGPLFDGGGSWLLSGRRSYLGVFDNEELIGLGLDVDRETGPITGPVRELGDRAVTAGDASAHFFDLHGKIFHEWGDGTRLTLSGYAGGDDARHDALRLVADVVNREVDQLVVETSNQWGNEAGSVRLHTPFGARGFLQSTAGFSRYRSEFSKDDFFYTDPTRALIAALDTTDHIIRPFRNENELTELKLSQEADLLTSASDVVSAGLAVHQYEVDYREESALRDNFGGTQSSTQLDAYSEFDGSLARQVGLQFGIRSHFFSHGDYFRVSPRLRLQLFPGSPISLGAGYSRNHQFIHRLYLEQNASADIWVLSTPDQPPTSVDHLTAGVYLRPSSRTLVQAEVYRKEFRNLREHVASAARRRLRPSSPILDPWLHDNGGLARGFEVMARHAFGPLMLSTSYTLSSMEITNARVNGGVPYPADWDRRHQFTTHARMAIARSVELHAVWLYASGAPNTLALAAANEPERLDPYHRMDLGVNVERALAGGVLGLELAVFNLYDRSNTWYRSPVVVVGRTQQGRRLGLMNVDVYDLGFQPSFEVIFHF